MQFEKIVGEDQLIELYGDRVESSGNDFVGGLAWIGTERVMWAEWESADQISIGSIRRLERLFKLASHSGRPFFFDDRFGSTTTLSGRTIIVIGQDCNSVLDGMCLRLFFCDSCCYKK